MQKSKSTTSPVSHVHNVLGHLLRDFTRFPALIFNIMFRHQRGSDGAVKTPPANVSPMSKDKTGTCRQLSGWPNA